jgi:hypothetical protein
MTKLSLSCVAIPNPFEKQLKRLPLIKRRKLLLWAAFSTCFLVFLINVILVVLAYNHLGNNNPDDYIRDLYSGDCNLVKRAVTGTHFAINVMSTLMLWASNTALQFIGSPTREAIDAAHRKGAWLDIGVVSLRNLWSIPRTNLAVWAVLALSSLPIHFL